MVTLIAPAPLVVGAPRVPLPFGLFSAFSFRAEGSGRWQAGVRWEPGTCEPADGIGAPDCAPEDTIGLPKELGPNNAEIGEASPFTIYGHYACSALSNSFSEAQRLANEHLVTREEARVEQALWTGDLGNVPNLAGANGYPEPTVVSGSGPIDIQLAVALLESFLGTTYGSTGVLHMGRTTATLAIARKVAETRGGRLYTKLGTPIVVGAGYPGTGPDGTAAAGTLWIYATPALFGYRSEMFDSSARPGDLMDRAQNDMVAVAERTYVIGFDPCGVGAAQITTASAAAPSGGGTVDPDCVYEPVSRDNGPGPGTFTRDGNVVTWKFTPTRAWSFSGQVPWLPTVDLVHTLPGGSIVMINGTSGNLGGGTQANHVGVEQIIVYQAKPNPLCVEEPTCQYVNVSFDAGPGKATFAREGDIVTVHVTPDPTGSGAWAGTAPWAPTTQIDYTISATGGTFKIAPTGVLTGSTAAGWAPFTLSYLAPPDPNCSGGIVVTPSMPGGVALTLTLGSIPSSPVPDGADVTAVVQTNVAPADPIEIWYSLNGGAPTLAGEATQVDTLEFVFNADESITATGDSVEVWAVSGTTESNHITIQVV